MDTLHGIASQNQRVRVLRRWLAKMPEKATALRLLTAGERPLTVREWPRAEVRPDLAEEIVSCIHEHMEDLGDQCPWEVGFVIVWLDGERVIGAKPLKERRAQHQHGDTDDLTAEDAARAVQPSDPMVAMMGMFHSAFRDMQAVNKAHAQMFFTGHNSLVFALVQVVDKLSDRLVTTEERIDAAREHTQAMVHQVMEAMGPEQSEAPAELTPAQQRVLDIAERALPLVLQRLMSAPRPPPPAAPPAAPPVGEP